MIVIKSSHSIHRNEFAYRLLTRYASRRFRLPELLQIMRLAVLQTVWLMHVGAPADFIRDLKQLVPYYSYRCVRRNWYCGLRDHRITVTPTCTCVSNYRALFTNSRVNIPAELSRLYDAAATTTRDMPGVFQLTSNCFVLHSD